jgi:glycosyltransferase involved in cell wall biosynthesis
MKVALFTDCLDQVNGISNTLHYLVRYCQSSGKTLDLYTHSDQGCSVEDLGTVRVLRYGYRMPIRYYSDMAFDLLCLRRAIEQEANRQAYSLIHLATPGSMGLNGLWVACLRHLPLIGSYHTALPEFVRLRAERIFPLSGPLSQRFGKLAKEATWVYLKWFYGRCRMLLVPSQAVLSALRRCFGNPMEIFSRGVDTERFHPRFRKGGEPLTVLYVGRLSVEKNLDTLVTLMADRRDIRLMLVGDGPSRKRLEQALPKAVFTGFLKGSDLSEAYASADLFISPSKTDTFGNVILEAMASGLPVLVTDQMGPPELVSQGHDGFVCRNVGELAQYLNVLADNRELRLRLGRNARTSAEKRSWAAVFENLFDQYARAQCSDTRPIAAQKIRPVSGECAATEFGDTL